eukprot:4788103-Alexandrium_andersonii.AAC.1
MITGFLLSGEQGGPSGRALREPSSHAAAKGRHRTFTQPVWTHSSTHYTLSHARTCTPNLAWNLCAARL